MNLSIFKEYDIRGIYPTDMNEFIAELVGKTVAKLWKSGKIVLAHDARIGSKELYATLLKTITQENKKIRIEKIGLATTPMFYFFVHKLKAQGGIMITASHNPKEWNGMKIVGKNAIPISGLEIKKYAEKYFSL